MNIVFLDANVFLDAFLERNEYVACKDVLSHVDDKMITAYTTAANLQNIIYFLSNAGIDNGGIISLMSVLLRYISLAQSTEKNFLLGLHAGFTDLEDAIQYYTAFAVKDIEYFITSNIKDYKKALPQLPVITPKQFLALQNKKK